MRPINILILITSFAITFGANWTDTTWAENPFMVRLQSTINQRLFACGGSIVYKGNPRNPEGVILTAAHCVEGASNVLVILRCTQSDCSDDIAFGYNTNNYVVHPQYDSTTNSSHINFTNNDIALVYLETAIFIQDAREVSLHSNINVLQNNAYITIFGYFGICSNPNNCVGGSDYDTLEYAVTNYMITTECENTWGSRVTGPHDFCVKDDNSDNGLQSICSGDSGSPAFYEGSQIGINSWGAESCNPRKPAVLTSIPYYYEWIRSECPLCVTSEWIRSASPTNVPTNVPTTPTAKPTKRPTAPTAHPTPKPTPKPYCISMWTFCGSRCVAGETQIAKKTCWTWFGNTVSKRKCRTCYTWSGDVVSNLLDIDHDDNDDDYDVVDHIEILLNALIVLLVITIALLVCNFIFKMVICCNKTNFKKSPNYKIVQNDEMDDIQDINVE